MNQTSVIVEWDQSHGATHYHVYIIAISGSNVTQYVITGLTLLQVSLPHNEEYNIYIRAANCNGNSSGPAIFTFTTG